MVMFLRRFLVEDVARICLDWLWLDPVTVVLEHRSLPEGVAVEETRCSCGAMRWCGYGLCYSLLMEDLVVLGFLLFARLGIALVS